MRIFYKALIVCLLFVASEVAVVAQIGSTPALRTPIPFLWQNDFTSSTATWVRNSRMTNAFSSVPDGGDSIVTVLFVSGITTASAGERFIYRVVSPTGFVYDSLGSTNLTSVTDTLGTSPAIIRFSAPIGNNVFGLRPEVSLTEANRVSFGRRVPNTVTINGFYYFIRRQ
jgi:hypothetical protein